MTLEGAAGRASLADPKGFAGVDSALRRCSRQSEGGQTGARFPWARAEIAACAFKSRSRGCAAALVSHRSPPWLPSARHLPANAGMTATASSWRPGDGAN